MITTLHMRDIQIVSSLYKFCHCADIIRLLPMCSDILDSMANQHSCCKCFALDKLLLCVCNIQEN